MNTTTARTARAGILLAAALLALAGCATGAPTSEAGTAADAVTVTDPWVKSADMGMSAAFGVIENGSDVDVTLTGVTSAASTMLELHETVENESGEMVMQHIHDPFVIPAGGTRALEPGADHIMLMDLTAPLVAGEEIALTLEFSDGSTVEFTAPVKDYSGANEEYMDDDMDMDE